MLPTIAEEAIPISPTFSAPADPAPSPVPPVLSFQQRAHIHSIDSGSSAPPLSIVSENKMYLPVWQVSHLKHDDPSDTKIVVPDFLSEFQHFRGGAIKVKPSRQTTHVRVHAGPHARRTCPGIAVIDTGSPQSFVSCSFYENMISAGAASLFGV